MKKSLFILSISIILGLMVFCFYHRSAIPVIIDSTPDGDSVFFTVKLYGYEMIMKDKTTICKYESGEADMGLFSSMHILNVAIRNYPDCVKIVIGK